MKSARWLAQFLFPIFLALPSWAAEETVVLFPPDLTMVKEAKVMIYAFRKGLPPIPVSVNGNAGDPLKGESLQSGQANLRPGMNTLDVGGKRLRLYFGGKAEMDYIRINPEKDGAPLVFQEYRLHPALGDGCDGCA